MLITPLSPYNIPPSVQLLNHSTNALYESLIIVLHIRYNIFFGMYLIKVNCTIKKELSMYIYRLNEQLFYGIGPEPAYADYILGKRSF